MYSFLELLFIVQLYKLSKYTVWTLNETILNVILVSIIATWRTEGIYYVVIAPVLIWIFMKGRDRKYKVILISFIVALTMVQFFVQSTLYNKSTSDDYELTAYINPVQELVGYSMANGLGEDNELITGIGSVFDVDVLTESYEHDQSGISAFWNGNVVKNHTSNDLKQMKMAYLGLIKKYPLVFIRERLTTYWRSDKFIYSTLNMQNDESEMIVWFRDSCPLTGIVNPELRKKCVRFIEIDDPNVHRVFYNPFTTQLFLIGLLVFCLVKKKYKYVGILALVLIRVPLVVLTAPERYFMYYFPTYLIGAVACAFVVTKRLSIDNTME